MDDRDALTHVRSMMARGDHSRLVTAPRHQPWPRDSLEFIGDGLLAAVRAGADGSVGLGHACVAALHPREWEGDCERADALNAALGSGPTPMLWPLPLELEELAMILEGDPVDGGRIDLRTREVCLSPRSSTPTRSA